MYTREDTTVLANGQCRSEEIKQQRVSCCQMWMPTSKLHNVNLEPQFSVRLFAATSWVCMRLRRRNWPCCLPAACYFLDIRDVWFDLEAQLSYLVSHSNLIHEIPTQTIDSSNAKSYSPPVLVINLVPLPWPREKQQQQQLEELSWGSKEFGNFINLPSNNS